MRGLFVGLATVDLILRVAGHPPANTKTVASERLLCAGGPAANAAIAFQGLGGAARLLTALGQSPLASLARADLASHGVELHDTASPQAGVPLAVVLSDALDGSRAVILSREVASLGALAPPDDELLDGIAVVLFDGHHAELALPVARAARRRGLPTVLDAGSWKPHLPELLPWIDCAIASADFAASAAGQASSTNDALGLLLEHGARQAAVSAGAEPIRWRTAGGDAGVVEVPMVQVVDTLGAGDVLHGAFAWYLAAGQSFAECLRQAAVVASESCRVFGRRRVPAA